MDNGHDLDAAHDVGSPVAAGGLAPEAALEFQALADNIPTLCWKAYADGHIYWYNARWYEYTGTGAQDQAGWGWESVHDPEVLPAVLDRWKHSLVSGTEFEMTFPLLGADGVYRPFLTRVVPIRDDGGAIVRWFGTNTDVSDLRASEARLASQIAELKALYDSAPIGLAFFSRDYHWIEHATVPIAPPKNLGFGTRIISASVERQLQGRVTQSWNPDGLHCRLEFKLRSSTAPAEG